MVREFGLLGSVKISLIVSSALLTFNLIACRSGEPNQVSPENKGAESTGKENESSVEKESVVANNASENNNGNGEFSAKVDGVSIHIKALSCAEDSPGITLCNKGVKVDIVLPGEKPVSVEPEALYVDSKNILYRGALDGNLKDSCCSVILADVNNDGKLDLILWTGKEGNYAGPSNSVYLFDPANDRYVLNQSLSDITVMTNGLFSVKGGALNSTSTDGCCIHIFDTYELKANEPVLVERITEDVNDPEHPKKKVERLQDGELKEVSS